MKLLRRSSPGTSHGRWLDIGSLVALAATVLGSIMAIGAVHPGVLACVFLVSVGAAGVLLVQQGVGREAALAAIILTLAAYSAFQALSLPASWVAALAAKNASVYAEALRPWRLAAPLRHSLSLDAHATWIESARFVCYAATLLLAARVVRAYGAVSVAALVFATALLLAVTTLGHGILEMRSVFGLYEPRYATPRWLSPLLNPNNLAGYLNLGLFCGGAVLMSRKAAPFRVPVILGMAIVLGVSVLCGSRGALLALLLGCAALAFRYRRDVFRWQARTWLQLGALVGAAALVLAVAARGETLRAYGATTTKLALFRWIAQLINDNAWFGVGRGAFESAFPPYRGASLANTTNNITFAHAENFVLQWAAEWGVPMLLAALAAIVYVARRWGRRANGSAFVLTGVGVLLFQNLADVALEVPGVCIALATLAAVFFASQGRDTSVRSPARTQWLAATASGAVVLLAAIGAWRLSRLDTVTEARDRLRALYARTAFAEAASAQTFDAELRAAVLARPGEPYFHLLGAMAARRTQGEPNRWLSRALERDPNRAETYFILGRVLAERGYVRQGLDTMQHALERQPSLARKVARAAIKISSKPELLVRVAPSGTAGCETLTEVARHLPQADRQPFLKEAVGRSPQCGDLALRHADALVANLDAAAPSDCDNKLACAEAAEQAIALAEKTGAPPERARLLRARVFASKAGPKEALAFLAGKCAPAAQDVECARLSMQLAARGGSAEDFTRLIREFLAVACDEDADCVKAEQLVGDLAAQRGDWILALAHHERAATLSGSSAAWRRYSEVARKAGAPSRAAEALHRAGRYDGATPSPAPHVDQPTDED